MSSLKLLKNCRQRALLQCAWAIQASDHRSTLSENTLLGVVGPEKYLGLWNGSVSFADPDVIKAMEVYGRMLDYQNSDHSALPDQAVKKLIEGSCVFQFDGRLGLW